MSFTGEKEIDEAIIFVTSFFSQMSLHDRLYLKIIGYR